MKLSAKYLTVLSIFIFSLVFLCGILIEDAFAKTKIVVNEAACEIWVILQKEFYIISTQGRNKWIQEAEDEINTLEQWLQEARQSLDAGIPFEGKDMAGSQQDYEEAEKRVDSLKGRKQELEDLNREDANFREGLTQEEINERIRRWDSKVERVWNGSGLARYRYFCCRVGFLYNYRMREEDEPASEEFDQVGIHLSSQFRSLVWRAGAYDNDGFSSEPFERDKEAEFALFDEEPGTFAHEAGHEMGLKDRYIEKRLPDGTIVVEAEEGYEGDIMFRVDGLPVSIGRIGGHWVKIDNINKILTKNNKVCPTPCCPQLPLGSQPREGQPPGPQPHEGQPPGPQEPPPEQPPGSPPREGQPPGPSPREGQQPGPQPREGQPPGTQPHEGQLPGPQEPPDSISRGSSGVTIVVECVEGRVLVKIYNSAGQETAAINKESLQSNSQILHQAIRQAGGSGSAQGSSSGTGGSTSSQSNSGNVTVLKQGIAGAELNAIADKLKEALEKNRDCKDFCAAFKDMPGIDFCEENYIRDVQKANAQVIPNDPFYFNPADHEELQIERSAEAIKTKADSGESSFGIAKPKGFVYHDQWGMHAIGFTPYSDPHSAWNLVDAEKKNVVVAVIDSGLDLEQPDGPRYLWVNPKEIPGNNKDDDGNGYVDDIHGWNFLAENSDFTDRKGHGTFVTGIIAAKANNGLAIAGINSGAQIMVLKVGDEDGRANSFNIYRALRYAADMGARVINISLASKGISILEQRGIDYAYGKGCVIVVAAGNQSGNLSEYGPPASHRVITVAAATPAPTIKRIWSSNIGGNVSLTAPGVSIYSLYSKDSSWTGPLSLKKTLCYKADGTSFAAPFVSGTASLLLAKNPKLSNAAIEDILLDTSTDMEDTDWDQYTGAGFLNASSALSSIGKKILTVRFMDLVPKRNEDKELTSIDLFGVVRGNLASYKVELAKGKKQPSGWQKIFESTKPTGESGFICSIDGKKVARAQEWSVRITAQDKEGNTKIAKMWFAVKK